jgi:Nucleotidyltransferase domain
MPDLPAPISDLADVLASMPGAVAVVLGGSRALGTAMPGSDWDLGVYYRRTLDTATLAHFGVVHPPGSWGRVMNGGAWLTIANTKVDVLFRDLDAVEHWSARASDGEFEVDALLGYLAGVPTYSLLAERAIAVPLRRGLPDVGAYPRKLTETGPRRWRYHSQFSLEHARMRAERGDVSGTAGQAAKAVIEEAHARLCRRGYWTLNEKGILEAASLDQAQGWFAAIPATTDALVQWVAWVRLALAGPA